MSKHQQDQDCDGDWTNSYSLQLEEYLRKLVRCFESGKTIFLISFIPKGRINCDNDAFI